MPSPSPYVPDCRLSHVLTGQIPRLHARALTAAVADAAGRYLRAGGSLLAIQVEESRIQDGRVLLMPPSTEGGTRLRPRLLEQELETLRERHPHFPGSPGDALKFLLRLARALDGGDGALWARLWIRRKQLEHQDQVRRHHRQAMAAYPPPRREGLAGTWGPDPDLSLPVFRQELLRLSETAGTPMHESRRAEVFQGRLLGEEVIVKQYHVAANNWKYRWLPSRARRAWAGANTLRVLGLPCPVPLGFLEVHEKGIARQSMFVCRRMPGTDNARNIIKPRLHKLPDSRRTQLRHQVRSLLLDLGKHGLYHRDTKLSNLMVKQEADGSMRFWWIDLEDIRAGHEPYLWQLIRNFMQINGSIGGHLPASERKKFADGFTAWHAWANHPLLLRYIAFRTRIRLGRELRRECKP